MIYLNVNTPCARSFVSVTLKLLSAALAVCVCACVLFAACHCVCSKSLEKKSAIVDGNASGPSFNFENVPFSFQTPL